MWKNIYPKLAENSLVLINDADSGVQHLAAVLNTLLNDLVDYVLNDEESIGILIKTITPYLKNKSISTMSLTMDWLILLLEKQPQSLEKNAEEILATMTTLLPDLETPVFLYYYFRIAITQIIIHNESNVKDI